MASRILIVEDFDDIRDAMSIMLELLGYDVVLATDGREAVSRAKQDVPDLILMDLAMPAFDGIKATKEIRTIPGLTDVPILAVTAYGQTLRAAALEAGCTDVVDKPAALQNIGTLVTKYLPEG